jgi:hypothetical protein
MAKNKTPRFVSILSTLILLLALGILAREVVKLVGVVLPAEVVLLVGSVADGCGPIGPINRILSMVHIVLP